MPTKPDKKANFIGVRLTQAEAAKLEELMDRLEVITGERNKSSAIRFLIRDYNLPSFNIEKYPNFRQQDAET